MRKERRRPMHYFAHVLHDGTVLASFPIRKPSKQELKRDHVRIDPEGVASEYADAGKNLRDVNNETRMRFQDIIATNLNSRRALRELVLPRLAETLERVQGLQEQLDRIEALLNSEPGRVPAPTVEPPPGITSTPI